MRAYSPIKEQEQEGVPLNNYEETASYSGCGCFKIFCFDWQHNRDGQSRSLLKGEHEEIWLVKKFKGLKEASEVVAGPKWKNLIRKIGKYFNTKKSKCQFQYDPESYALNFDHGGVGGHEEEDGVLLGFPSRFAPPVSSDHQRTTGL